MLRYLPHSFNAPTFSAEPYPTPSVNSAIPHLYKHPRLKILELLHRLPVRPRKSTSSAITHKRNGLTYILYTATIMAAPAAKTIKNLNGKWSMVSPSLSTSKRLHLSNLPRNTDPCRTKPSPTTRTPFSSSKASAGGTERLSGALP